MKTLNMSLETLACPACLIKIDKALKLLDGIDKDSVNVMFNSSKVKLKFDNNIVSVDKIEEAITKLGYEVLKVQVKD